MVFVTPLLDWCSLCPGPPQFFARISAVPSLSSISTRLTVVASPTSPFSRSVSCALSLAFCRRWPSALFLSPFPGCTLSRRLGLASFAGREQVYPLSCGRPHISWAPVLLWPQSFYGPSFRLPDAMYLILQRTDFVLPCPCPAVDQRLRGNFLCLPGRSPPPSARQPAAQPGGNPRPSARRPGPPPNSPPGGKRK